MPLLVLEYPKCNVRTAINTDRLLDEINASEAGQDIVRKSRAAHQCVMDFIAAWHSAAEGEKPPLPAWIVYIHVDETIVENGKEKRPEPSAPI